MHPGIGELPGMWLSVNPATGEWRSEDPLYRQEGKLERIRLALSKAFGIKVVDQKLKGIRSRSGKVDENTMKTLCLELLGFLEADEARLVKGTRPTKEEIDELPGRYLLNWSNLNKWQQPKFADQYDHWVMSRERLDDVVARCMRFWPDKTGTQGFFVARVKA